jgi:hypothetical protein
MGFSYRKLKNELNRLTDEQLDQDATIYDSDDNEFYPVKDHDLADETVQGVLDNGHYFLVIKT